jgi:hypothetical protein
MTKKKRAAKRSTKAGKRRPSTKRVAAKGKGGAFQSGAFQSGAFQGLPPSASQQKPSPAVQSTIGEVSPPDISSTRTAANMAGAAGLDAGPFVLPAPVPITPTVYPDSPQGTIIVQNYVTINGGSVEFRNFDTTINGLVNRLSVSNEISGDVRGQLLAEIAAGREALKAPKVNRDLIKLLLIGPLTFLAKTVASSIIGTLAGQALELLMKML